VLPEEEEAEVLSVSFHVKIVLLEGRANPVTETDLIRLLAQQINITLVPKGLTVVDG
tara:strand:- start:379 stop:549 length:171 start_codon:yes stop_codon:yes gene_type:complete